MELSAPPLEGWQERFNTEKQNGHMDVTIRCMGPWTTMSRKEIERLLPKLRLVEELAEKLAWNMLKGTLKYERDDWPLQMWLDMGIDDGADGLNYQLLLRDQMEREGLL